ncbi:MAG TPA: molybdopterin-binding protein [Micropepsaceae bacterium]|nr:molybdopterin-binding protein [Micropepsaceae bacterium]
MTRQLITRRSALRGIIGTGGLVLSGCDQLSQNQTFQRMLAGAEKLNLGGQRLVLNSSTPLAREYQKSDISRVFKANGTIRPEGDAYRNLALAQFSDWKLQIGGLVNKPLSFSLGELRNMPSRTQITRHDCVEGWSAIGQWTGVPLSTLLKLADLKPNAKYIVFRCADDLIGSRDGSGLYYESIDLVDAFHPQTIMAYAMNGQTLPVEHGAPLRLRVERQLGYKMAKYVMRIEAVEEFSKIGIGKGGFWEDRGYEWYAGI